MLFGVLTCMGKFSNSTNDWNIDYLGFPATNWYNSLVISIKSGIRTNILHRTNIDLAKVNLDLQSRLNYETVTTIIA